jgi:hypothetical protein
MNSGNFLAFFMRFNRERSMLTRRNTAKKRRRHLRKQPVMSAEDRRTEAVTVAWMLTVFATFIADIAMVVAHFVVSSLEEATEVPSHLRALPPLLLLIAACAGILCLALIYPTHVFRRDPPPRSITIFAVLVALAPLVTIAVLLVRR